MYALVFAELTGEAALIQLEACRTPKDKVAVLVAAHKVVVGAFLHLGPLLFVGITHRTDRLYMSKLPPIRLIPEKEMEKSTALSLYRGELEGLTSTSHKADDDEPSISLDSSFVSGSTSAPSKPTSTPISGDLLPILIFSVAKSNRPNWPPTSSSHCASASKSESSNDPPGTV